MQIYEKGLLLLVRAISKLRGLLIDAPKYSARSLFLSLHSTNTHMELELADNFTYAYNKQR